MPTFAVFGDIHGRVLLMLQLVERWQAETGGRVDAILQVGDFGAFPDVGRLDRATSRHAARDPDELGFSAMLAGASAIERILVGTAAPPVLFIRGNHEDFDWLAGFSRPAAVDPWGRVTFLPDGQIADLEVQDAPAPLRVAGFGGIHPIVEEQGRGPKAREAWRQAARRAAADPRRFTADDVEKAFQRCGPVEVLLTHAGPRGEHLPEGSLLLGALAGRLRPRAHFFGHHHRAVAPRVVGGATLTAGLDHLEHDRSGQLRHGCWGVLRIEAAGLDFEYADRARLPWLREFDRSR